MLLIVCFVIFKGTPRGRNERDRRSSRDKTDKSTDKRSRTESEARKSEEAKSTSEVRVETAEKYDPANPTEDIIVDKATEGKHM
mgnify:CR=1 FL=1